jgi:hypothetical protein
MLTLVLDVDRDDRGRPVTALISDALTYRAHLAGVREGPAERPSRAADRIADCLAYDAALVRLCDRLDIQQELTADSDTGLARKRIEARLAERLPTLAAALGGPR